MVNQKYTGAEVYKGDRATYNNLRVMEESFQKN